MKWMCIYTCYLLIVGIILWRLHAKGMLNPMRAGLLLGTVLLVEYEIGRQMWLLCGNSHVITDTRVYFIQFEFSWYGMTIMEVLHYYEKAIRRHVKQSRITCD